MEALGYSRVRIAASVGSSRHRVKAVLDTAREKWITRPLECEVGNEEIGQILFPDRCQSIGNYAEPDCAVIHKELAKPGVTMTLMWDEYRARCYENGQTPYQSKARGDSSRHP